MEDLPGDFVLVARGVTAGGREQHLIATSVVGTRPYFYVDAAGPARHGEDVFALAAPLGWEWDLEALRSVAWLGHTVDGQSLHPKVRRVPADSVLVHDGGGPWQVKTQDYWTTVFDRQPVSVDDAVDVLVSVTDDVVQGTPLVSLSAGFDSRALLAIMLSSGKRPRVLTMGHNEATDVVAARQIAAAEELEHTVVTLDPAQYLPAASTITRLTGGTKTFGNWHTYLYPRGQTVPDQQHLVGANGEFARSFYLDKGPVSLALGVGRRPAVAAYWGARISRRSSRMAPWLPFLSPRGKSDALSFSNRVAALASDGGGDGLERLDRFYSRHRVRHFIGNGIALYSAHGQPVSPFLDARWITAAANLPRPLKLGSNFHRRVVQRVRPELLRHSVGGGGAMAATAPKDYWRQRHTTVSYSPAPALLATSEVTEILANSPHLSDLMNRQQVTSVATTGSIEVKEFLLTLHFAGEAASGT